MEIGNSEEKNTSEKMQYLLQKEILTFDEACLYLGRSASDMYKLTSGKQVPYYKPMGKLIYFRKSELDDWVLRNKTYSQNEIEKDAATYLIQTKKQ